MNARCIICGKDVDKKESFEIGGRGDKWSCPQCLEVAIAHIQIKESWNSLISRVPKT